MTKQKINPSVYFDQGELDLIKAAAKLIGLSVSSFVRSSALTNAKRKLNDLKEVSLQNGSE